MEVVNYYEKTLTYGKIEITLQPMKPFFLPIYVMKIESETRAFFF